MIILMKKLMVILMVSMALVKPVDESDAVQEVAVASH